MVGNRKEHPKLIKEIAALKDLMDDRELRSKLFKINNHRYDIVKENESLLAQGKHKEYDANCNFLRGMTYVLEQLK